MHSVSGCVNKKEGINLARLFCDHAIEAALVLARLSTADILHLAVCSRAIGLALPGCMLRAAELGLLPWRVESDMRKRVDRVPFTWPYPGRVPSAATGPASPFASWADAFAAEASAASAPDAISRLVRWTAAARESTAACAEERAYSEIAHVAGVDAQWSSKGDRNWWLDESEHERTAERERRADEALSAVKRSVRDHAKRLKVAARTQADPTAAVTHLRRDTAQMIYESAFQTHFARDHLCNHYELDGDDVALSCGIGPPLRTAQDHDPDRRFFDDTVDYTVDLLIDRRPPPGVDRHGAQTVDAVLTLVGRWDPCVAFVDRIGALSDAGAISPAGPCHDTGDEWTVTRPNGSARVVFENALRAHLRKRLDAYAPYLCAGLSRLCAAVAIIARACRVGDRAVVTAAATLFGADMAPHIVAMTLDGALSRDAIVRQAFGDRIGFDAIPESKATRAVAVNAKVIVSLLLRSLDAIAALVVAYPNPSQAECRLAARLFDVADAIVTRVAWKPQSLPESSLLAVADGRIRMTHNGASAVMSRMRCANCSVVRALFAAADVDAWVRVVAQPGRHPFRRFLIAGQYPDGPLPSPMASMIHMVLRAIHDTADRSHDQARADADRARAVLVAFGHVIGRPAEASAACDALAVLYELSPLASSGCNRDHHGSAD
ncbi:hypothetical protein psal_cds_335 [Pandoravirus salinus]|uniref:Uncharacterized protein n=1 Tax=Pandoravirus salinus TaxID=1349410 RepID=S4W1I8_9VIRU|nr:hypothetical protein psal_cds_335 [Pandoravirus salinus]AGO83970.1 hypothetical protein psal_cds_335 [Pandoravirus salinus]